MPRASLADVCGIGTGRSDSTEIRGGFFGVDAPFAGRGRFISLIPDVRQAGEPGRNAFAYREGSNRPAQADILHSAA
jgi:hypothetical protein